MNKIVVHTEEEYHKEKKKREKIYRNLCEKSGDLWDKYEKDKSYHREFFDTLKKIDPAFLDWQDGVIYEWKGE